MEIKNQLSRAAYIKLLLLRRISKWSFYILVFMLLLVLFISFITSDFVFLYVMLAFCIFAVFYPPLYLAFSPKNRNFFLPTKYIFTDESVTEITPVSTAKMEWAVFVKWEKVSKYYLLFISNITFILIKEDAIPEQEEAYFKTLISDKIKKR